MSDLTTSSKNPDESSESGGVGGAIPRTMSNMSTSSSSGGILEDGRKGGRLVRSKNIEGADDGAEATENDRLLNRATKFNVTKLKQLDEDEQLVETTKVTITKELSSPLDQFSSSSASNTLNKRNSNQLDRFNNSYRFKQQNSIIDPFPHFDNYRNNMLSLSTSYSNVGSNINSTSNLNSSYSIELDNSMAASNPQYENTLNADQLTPLKFSAKKDGLAQRPTLHELQTAVLKKAASEDQKVPSGNSPAKSLDSKKEKEKKAGDEESAKPKDSPSKSRKKKSVVKFGWIEGVLIRCILNIFGVMIFLRLTWVVGQAGVGLATVIIFMATLVTLITALSTSAISTNGEVKAGGAYYLISRSLGPEFGGAIGIVFSFANAVASSMYVIGFSETLVYSVFGRFNIRIIDGAVNDVRIIGLATIVILLAIALIGMSWEAKVQIFLLITLVVAFIDFLIGSFLKPSESQRAKGFVGYDFGLLRENFMPDFRGDEDFAHVFGVFFPAVTGILAGANISGNLKNPQMAIPKGTILSIFITSFIYLLFCWIAGATVLRDASGEIPVLLNGTIANLTVTSNATKCTGNCKYGLLNNYDVIEMVSVYGPIITAGIFSASLSSALASLVSAPKIFQAVGKDKIFKKIEYFAKGYGKDNEPWRGYFLTFALACLFIAIGDLNQIAPIISNFFLMSYALVNYACFDASVSKTPGWRPSFKYYNKWISLFGAILCICIMFLIKWWAALVSFLCILAIYLYVKQSKPDINWGSTGEAHIYRRSLEYSLKLMNIKEHVKNYRPNFLVLTGEPSKRPALADFVATLSKDTSLMVCGNVIQERKELMRQDSTEAYSWLRKRKIKSFYTEVDAPSLRSGCTSLMQSTGIGKLKPNALVIGFKNNWQNDKFESVLEYYWLINDAFQMEFSLLILRLDGGLDYSNLLGDSKMLYEDNGSSSDDDFFAEFDEENDEANAKLKLNLESELKKKIFENDEANDSEDMEVVFSVSGPTDEIKPSPSKPNQETNDVQAAPSQPTLAAPKQLDDIKELKASSSKLAYKSTELIKLKNAKINTGVLQGVNLFHHNHQDGFVDVYWLHDDGGLTILIPYLMMQRKYWKKCKLRIFVQTYNKSGDVVKEQKNMENLLRKFRIEFHELIILTTLKEKANPASLLMHETMIENWRLKPNESIEEFPYKISDTVYKENMHKINYYLRIREVLLEHSKDSAMIFVTISVPNKIRTSPGLYMSYLDLISYKLPPVVLIRGNQKQVVTYYS